MTYKKTKQRKLKKGLKMKKKYHKSHRDATEDMQYITKKKKKINNVSDTKTVLQKFLNLYSKILKHHHKTRSNLKTA